MTNKAKILIVDDNVDTVELLTKRFHAEGYDTSEAYDGEQALQQVKEYQPDIIILDIMMYHELKTEESLKEIPVIVLSPIPKKSFLKSQKVLDEFAGQSVPEPEAYIEKPEEPEELIALMKKILG